MSRPSITTPPATPQLALLGDQDVAHARQTRDGGGGGVDLGRADRPRHVLAIDEHHAVADHQHGAPRHLGTRLVVGEIDPLAERLPGDRSIHRARVDVPIREPARDLARDGPLAGAGGAVDGEDQTSEGSRSGPARRWRSRCYQRPIRDLNLFPRYAYSSAGGSPRCAITGGAFYEPGDVRFPEDYYGDYFFADYCSGEIFRLRVATNEVEVFASGISSPVDLRVGA